MYWSILSVKDGEYCRSLVPTVMYRAWKVIAGHTNPLPQTAHLTGYWHSQGADKATWNWIQLSRANLCSNVFNRTGLEGSWVLGDRWHYHETKDARKKKQRTSNEFDIMILEPKKGENLCGPNKIRLIKHLLYFSLVSHNLLGIVLTCHVRKIMSTPPFFLALLASSVV